MTHHRRLHVVDDEDSVSRAWYHVMTFTATQHHSSSILCVCAVCSFLVTNKWTQGLNVMEDQLSDFPKKHSIFKTDTTFLSVTNYSQWVILQLLFLHNEIRNYVYMCITQTEVVVSNMCCFLSSILVNDVTTILSVFLGKPHMERAFEHRPLTDATSTGTHATKFSKQPFFLHSPEVKI